MQWFQGPMAAVLSLSLVAASTPGVGEIRPPKAADEPSPSASPAYRQQLQGDIRILHALNRFTFGPRAGDLEIVRAMGLDGWFDAQLHPATIENAALQARLGAFPAMQWSTRDLLFRLPSNAVVRQVANGRASMPANTVLHAIYASQAERLSDRRARKEAKNSAPATLPATPGDGSGQTSTGITSASGSAGATPDQVSSMAGLSATPASAKPPAVDLSLTNSIVALPPRERVERLIALEPEKLWAFFKSLDRSQRLELEADLTPLQKLIVQALRNPERAVAEELLAERLTRDIYSNAQLQEVMTDFWLNHFNVYLRKDQFTPYYLVSYERDVIRPRALGKFEDLLEAVAHSPAMLIYLDNAQSTGPDSKAAKIAAGRISDKTKKAQTGLNENYARELMELHTVGVNGGYTQADVIQAARILTGWTVDHRQRGGDFIFDEQRHQPGTKRVLGHKFKKNGEKEGRDLLHMLATRPATAEFISHKLAARFVSDDPPQALVDRMAKAYLSSGGDISTVLRVMYRSPEFWSADAYRAKVKTPLEYVVSAVRASDAEVEDVQPLVTALRDMGMPLYGCVPPTGYKWDAADWVSTGALVTRMNFALRLAANRLRGVNATWIGQPDLDSATAAQTVAPAMVTPEEEEARLETRMVAGGVSDATRRAVLDQFERQNAAAVPVNMKARPRAATSSMEQDQVLAGLLLGSPEFQRR